jgi:lipoprotein-anchoring transpeptidase ErfK/SrfK
MRARRDALAVVAAATLAATSLLSLAAQSGGGCGPSELDVPVAGARVRRVAHEQPVVRPARRDAALALRINVPAYRLDVVLDSAVAWSYGVAVGTRRYRTPTGAFQVQRVVWNPWWIPPKSPWARHDTVTPPGPANPMGKVKLLLGASYYVHGTPATASIGRAASHGCIRMRDADAIALARLVLASAGVPASDSAIAAILGDSMTTYTAELPVPVAADVVYEIAEVRHDSLLLHPDVYGREAGRARALALLAVDRAGRDTALLRKPVLAAALRRARGRHVAVALDSLLRSPRPDSIPAIARSS